MIVTRNALMWQDCKSSSKNKQLLATTNDKVTNLTWNRTRSKGFAISLLSSVANEVSPEVAHVT